MTPPNPVTRAGHGAAGQVWTTAPDGTTVLWDYPPSGDATLSAPPSVGTFQLGDHVWNAAPVAEGYAGWVCVTAGTPGTWLPFGQIATNLVADLDGGFAPSEYVTIIDGGVSSSTYTIIHDGGTA